jgi:Ca2+:H+ antiporter
LADAEPTRRLPPLLIAGLVLGPVVVVLDRLEAAGGTALFALAAAALVPLAWLIGEATEEAAGHTGPGIGGLLNASFGNAPELIVALTALADDLPEVVRASLTGSIVGNLLLVLGATLAVRRPGPIDRTSALLSLATIAFATLVLVIPSVAGLHGDPERHALAVLSLPVAAVILAVRLLVNSRALRRQQRLQGAVAPPDGGAWSLRVALVVLGLATVMTAFVTETLVGALEQFANDVHLSEFFVAAVIVAIVGNAAEHGSAVLIAARGGTKLATEIALASSAQVAGFLIPVIALLSWAIEPLALSFRPVELAAIGGAAGAAGLVLLARRPTRAGGALLVAAYVGVAVAFYFAGER